MSSLEGFIGYVIGLSLAVTVNGYFQPESGHGFIILVSYTTTGILVGDRIGRRLERRR